MMEPETRSSSSACEANWPKRLLRLLGAWEQILLVGLIAAMIFMVVSLLWPKPKFVITLKSYTVNEPQAAEPVLPASEVMEESAASMEGLALPPVRKISTHRRSGFHSKKPKNPPVLNLNQATSAQLQLLNGIGPKMALRIIEYRKANGGFKTIEQVMEVKGIGPKKFEKIKTYLRI
jgi:comEA protein